MSVCVNVVSVNWDKIIVTKQWGSESDGVILYLTDFNTMQQHKVNDEVATSRVWQMGNVLNKQILSLMCMRGSSGNHIRVMH